jgi:ATP-dependent helicase/nuclease subunit A
MSAMSDGQLPFDDGAPSLNSRIDARDREARTRAVDPRFNVALEASAGTGKTKVLVDRYVNLLDHGVDPASILAMTFTRKAAAEMRERIVRLLYERARAGTIPASRWRRLRDRLGDVAISTIDAFCLSLLREFPLEADLDPGFSMADETEVPRLIDESLDRALQICRNLARDDEDVSLVFAHLGERRTRLGLAALLGRRIVAPRVLAQYLETAPPGLDATTVTERAARGLLGVFMALPGGLDAFLETGPMVPSFLLLTRDLRRLQQVIDADGDLDPPAVQTALERTGEHMLTQAGKPRKALAQFKAEFASEQEFRSHRELVAVAGPVLESLLTAHRGELNMLAARGLRRMFAVATTEYRRTLDAHAALDFSDVLLRALALLRQMEEFAQSRYRLESRYQHLLVDEFQDTSRAQWELVSLLVQSWGEGAGLSASGPLLPSIFIVGDRKQAIYGFREADVSILREAGRYLDTLRPGSDVRRAVSRSFRGVAPLLAFVNDVCADIDKAPERRDRFEYEEQDRFPVEEAGDRPVAVGAEPLGLVVADEPKECAEAVADEVARLIATGVTVRDRLGGAPRAIRPGDVAILFRTREAYRDFEQALERRGLPVYVYKGMGFFDADEVKDVLAVLRYLADPFSDLRTAALLRSRLVRFSDDGLRRLAPRLAQALRQSEPVAGLNEADARTLDQAREAVARWRGLVDRIPPADLLDRVLAESAYGLELRGPRLRQARENLKKIRGLVRRVENRGYATLDRISAHLDRLSVGEEPNALIDALDAVNLMTVHAAKGLEFPVVFVVNLHRGTGGRRPPVRLSTGGAAPSVAIGSFQSDVDTDAVGRDREETKRLVYVALTRARDRLYLGAVRRDGVLNLGRGSLAEVLPASLVAVLSSAGGQWRAASGQVHRFHVCAVAARNASEERDGKPDGPLQVAPQTGCGVPVDRASLPVMTAVATVSALSASGGPPAAPGLVSSTQTLGTLVHRLLERLGLDAELSPEAVADTARDLLVPNQTGDPGEGAMLLTEAAALFDRIRRHPSVRRVYGAGQRFHEVPFTMTVEGRPVRGAIDCLVRSDDRITILEFKTGQRRSGHAEQLAFYRQAVEGLFPGVSVDAEVIYPDEVV